MSFDEIVADICDRLNLSSSEAKVRVGKLVNRKYKLITAELGIASTSRRSFAFSTNMTIGSAEVTFTACEKVLRVYYLDDNSEKVFLHERNIHEIQDETSLPTSDTPTRWAVKSMSARTVTIKVDALAETTYAMKAEGFSTVSVLAGSSEPAFPESYHEVLITSVLADEYRKKEKKPLADDERAETEILLGKLRLWAAKSAYMRIRQGERSRESTPFADSEV